MMFYIRLLLFAAVLSHSSLFVFAQVVPSPRVLQTDSGAVTYHYFKHGTVSTMHHQPKNFGKGDAIAYDSVGHIIAKYPCGYYHGTRSVEFQYHDNGGVRSIRVSHQPDGAIQNYTVTYLYDNKGRFLEERDNSLPQKLNTISISEAKALPKFGEGAYNEFEITNATPNIVKIVYYLKSNPKEVQELSLKAGETKYAGRYSFSGTTEKPESKYIFKVTTKKTNTQPILRQWDASPLRNKRIVHHLFILDKVNTR